MKKENGWQVKSLSDVADVIAGQSPPSSTYNQQKIGLPFYQGKADFGEKYPSVRIWCSEPTKIALPNDILISVRAPVGPTNICDTEACIGRGLSAIRVKKNSDYRFILYYLRSFENKLVQQGRGSTFAAITQLELKKLPIPLPPLPIQKQIAEILEKADKAKQKRKEANKLTDEFLQSVFIEMFGDPVRNPKGWGVKKIKEIVSIPLKNGAYFTEDKYTNDDNGVEMVHMSDAFYETVRSGGLKKVIVNESEKLKYELKINDILIARRSLNFEGAAKACLVKIEGHPMIYESSFIRIRVDQNIISPIYLFHFLSNKRARKAYISKYVTSSTISGINQTNLAEVALLIPPLSLQGQFAEIVNKTEALKEKQKQSEQELENLFQSLMQRAFKGELVS